jgi:hypothetical protein
LIDRVAAASAYFPGPSRGVHKTGVADAAVVPANPITGRRLRRTSKLCNTYHFTLPPEEALAALRKLRLERFSLEFVAIPATGGCVVAVFAPLIPEPDVFSRFRIARQQHVLGRLLTSLGATAV